MTEKSSDEKPNLAFSPFFSAYRKFSIDRDALKASGHHDFNPLVSIRDARSEELHSSFIHALMDPDGKHYQGTRFLQRFLDILGFESIDVENTVVKKEHSPRDTRRRIDLYISDGHQHVIIENKIDAQDQPSQAQHYIERMRAKDGGSPPECVHFVYLTLKNADPDSTSLGDFRIEDTTAQRQIVDAHGNPQAQYRRITFAQELLEWVNRCLTDVKATKAAEGSIDLWLILNEYKKVVLKVTKKHTQSVPTLSDFLEADPSQTAEKYQHAVEIQKALPKVQKKWLTEAFLEQIPTLIKEQFNELDPVSTKVFPGLKGRIFSEEDAKNRFYAAAHKEPNDAQKNKGVFWVAEETVLGFPVALCVLYGSKNLHIGLMPLVKEGELFNADPSSQKINAILECVKASSGANEDAQQIRKYDAINGPFPGLVSWTAPLNDCMADLSDVQGGVLWRIIKDLMKAISTREQILYGKESPLHGQDKNI